MRRFSILLLSLMAMLIVIPQVVAQTFSVTITSAHCDYVVFTYNSGIDGGTVNFTTNYGGTNSANSPGSGSLVITFAEQPVGTPITVTMTHSVTANSTTSTALNCTNSYGEPPATNPDIEPIPPWDGETDDRLNPDPAEYYTIFCQNDNIDIYVSNPQTDLIKQVSMADVMSLNVGATMELGDNMSLVRNTEDTVTIYGSNGNTEGEGEKAFSLSNCIDANGGEPEINEPPSGDSQAEQDNNGGSQPSFFDLLIDILPGEFEGDGEISILELFSIIAAQCIFGGGIATVFGVGGTRLLLHRVRSRLPGNSSQNDYDHHRFEEIGRDLD